MGPIARSRVHPTKSETLSRQWEPKIPQSNQWQKQEDTPDQVGDSHSSIGIDWAFNKYRSFIAECNAMELDYLHYNHFNCNHSEQTKTVIREIFCCKHYIYAFGTFEKEMDHLFKRFYFLNFWVQF
jgi:hypothetical protein